MAPRKRTTPAYSGKPVDTGPRKPKKKTVPAQKKAQKKAVSNSKYGRAFTRAAKKY